MVVRILIRFSFALGNNFAKYIRERKPLVFTRESNDPYVCNHSETFDDCKIRFSEALELSGIPEGVNGPNCATVKIGTT